MGVTFEEEEEDKLQQLVASTVHSKATFSSKSTYVALICYSDKGEGSWSCVVLEALLAYWLS